MAKKCGFRADFAEILKFGCGPENPIFGQKWAKKDRFLTIFGHFSTKQDFQFSGGIRRQNGVSGKKRPRGTAGLAPMSKLKISQKSRSSPLFNSNSVGKYEENGHEPSGPKRPQNAKCACFRREIYVYHSKCATETTSLLPGHSEHTPVKTRFLTIFP